LIGVSTTFAFSPDHVAEVCHRLRQQYPESTILLGGAGITLNQDWLESTDDAAFAILGDAEAAFSLLLDSLVTGAPTPEEIPNLAIRTSNGEWHNTPRSQFPINLIPTPRWDLANEGHWPEVIWYESQRGCPFRCTFCSYPNQALSWIGKSPERMAEEFEYFADRGVSTIYCFDSTMVTPPKRMLAFCELLGDRDIQLRWHCYAHAANLQSPPLTRAMFAAGCRSVSIGLESCDDTVLHRMKKHVSARGIETAIHNCLDAGLICAVNVIIGFPGETHQTYRHTVSSLIELEPDTIGCQAFQVRDRTIPILHTDNFNLHVDHGPQPYWKHDGMDRNEATRLAVDAIWEVAVRADRTIVSPVGAAARAPLAVLDDREASRFRRHWINPVVNSYGRYICFEPRFKLIDQFLGRPEHIPHRSQALASLNRDRTLRLWEAALTACPH